MFLCSEDFIRRVPPAASIMWLSQSCLRSISREAETLWFPGGFPPAVGKGVCLGNNRSTVSYPRSHTEVVMVRQGSIRESPEDSWVYYVYGTFLDTHRLIKNNLVIAGQVFPFTSVFFKYLPLTLQDTYNHREHQFRIRPAVMKCSRYFMFFDLKHWHL